jgi:hypothetical protein
MKHILPPILITYLALAITAALYGHYAMAAFCLLTAALPAAGLWGEHKKDRP